MKGYKLLQVGEKIKNTDEIKHRGRWYSVLDFILSSNVFIEGMKPIRRKIKDKEI